MHVHKRPETHRVLDESLFILERKTSIAFFDMIVYLKI